MNIRYSIAYSDIIHANNFPPLSLPPTTPVLNRRVRSSAMPYAMSDLVNRIVDADETKHLDQPLGRSFRPGRILGRIIIKGGRASAYYEKKI